MLNVCLDHTGAIGLHVHPSRKESAKVAKNSYCFALFRALTPGVPKWCPRGAPGVVKGYQQAPPAALNVAKRGAKDVEMVPGCLLHDSSSMMPPPDASSMMPHSMFPLTSLTPPGALPRSRARSNILVISRLEKKC